ncbi:MAG TPA: Clp protease N-terminal domain-containing protein [Acidimicrobiales bacterium]|jgi:ATP-dependent Clp protease ATP-binding subunit ClpC|nr:Clp protease N-terminal domain-containing protein [Acidimicrobiales bacterium]
MPKINVYLPEELAAAVKEAQVPVSAICQAALERAVRDVTSARGSDEAPDESRAWSGLFGRFTPRARRAVTLAEEAARAIPHNYVGTEHVLLGVIDEGSNLALKVLQTLDIEIDDLRGELTASVGPATERPQGHIPFTPRAKHVLELTAKESMALGHNYIGCEHVLLGLIAEEQGMAGKVLRRMGVELRTTRRAVVTALSGFLHAQQSTSTPNPSGDDLAEIRQRLEAIEQRLDS